MPSAMVILRPLIELRLPVRDEAMTVLLELMTHPCTLIPSVLSESYIRQQLQIPERVLFTL